MKDLYISRSMDEMRRIISGIQDIKDLDDREVEIVSIENMA